MYTKLMIRGLLRHRKRGRRLFILIALCSTALVVLLTFRNDFYRQNRDQFIGIQTGHLEILPPDSPILADSFVINERSEVPLLNFGDDFDIWLNGLPEVEEAAPVISRYGIAYNLDSEEESWISLVALPAERLSSLFPLATITEGDKDFLWNDSMIEVPMLRARLQPEFGETQPDSTCFTALELKGQDDDLPDFMSRIASDFPAIFISSPYLGETDMGRFLNDWKVCLSDPDFYHKIPEKFTAVYDWKIDDAVQAAQDNTDPEMVSFLNKRIFQALYPDDIVALQEPVRPGKQISLQVSPFTTETATDLPIVIPARYAGMCEILPLYMANSFMDIDAFRTYLHLDRHAATAWVIRLHDVRDTNAVREKIEAKLAEMHSDAEIRDYNFLGKMYLTTGLAFSALIIVLIVIFVVILLIFIINLVLMSMIQRRKEIGTGLALGLDTMQTIVIMTGEIAVIVTVSCTAGCLLGLGAILIAAHFGIPGMVFFIGGKLHLTLQALPFVTTYLLMVPTSIVTAFIPLLRMRKLLPVDLFREGH